MDRGGLDGLDEPDYKQPVGVPNSVTQYSATILNQLTDRWYQVFKEPHRHPCPLAPGQSTAALILGESKANSQDAPLVFFVWILRFNSPIEVDAHEDALRAPHHLDEIAFYY